MPIKLMEKEKTLAFVFVVNKANKVNASAALNNIKNLKRIEERELCEGFFKFIVYGAEHNDDIKAVEEIEFKYADTTHPEMVEMYKVKNYNVNSGIELEEFNEKAFTGSMPQFADGIELLKNMLLHVENLKSNTSNSVIVQENRLTSIEACLKEFNEQFERAKYLMKKVKE